MKAVVHAFQQMATGATVTAAPHLDWSCYRAAIMATTFQAESMMDLTLHALNRFGLGARRGERRQITDPRGWLRAQIDGGPPLLTASAPSPEAIGEIVRGFRKGGQTNNEDRKQARRSAVELSVSEVRASLTERITSSRPFVERLVAFWSNHLCVSSSGKFLVAPFAGAYERDVIRPHVLGKFEDMVLASARHPAMLVYLDNFQSVGPDSKGARVSDRNANTKRGLNENYARELMELHTVGVDGGYTQKDVQELARVLTGWTIDGLSERTTMQNAQRLRRLAGEARGRRRGTESGAQMDSNGAIVFAFREALHQPGRKTVLGQRYGEDGVSEGERAIRALCRRPSTAQFIATKLARHFISDTPPEAAVGRIAHAFSSSDGNLKTVARAIIEEPDAWRDDTRKFRTPQDWLVAVLRAFGATDVGVNMPGVLKQLRQPLWAPMSPKGFGDTMQEWADPDSLMNRGELARTIGRLPTLRGVDPTSFTEVIDVAGGDPLLAILRDTSIPSGERAALAVAGPAFQWR